MVLTSVEIISLYRNDTSRSKQPIFHTEINNELHYWQNTAMKIKT